MNSDTLKHAGRFIIVVFIQVVVLNQLVFSGYITPFIYPVFLLLLPFDIKGWALLLLSFLLGITIDMFSDSLGMHAAASVFIGFMRPFVISLISSKTDFDSGTEPRLSIMGLPWIFFYTIILIFLHHLFLFFVEIWGIGNLFEFLLRTFTSSVVSTLLILVFHLLLGNVSKSRRL
ncbi:MAG: rod shape-determining protein MreD [Bacteroidota bacterium]